MTLPKVLLLGSNLAPEHINHQLQTVAELHTLPDMDDETAPGEIRRMVKEHGPFVVFAGFYAMKAFPLKWDENLFGSLMPGCKCIVYPGVGYETADVDWISNQGAYLCNTPREMGRRTADGTLHFILTVLKGTTPRDHACRAGQWRTPSVPGHDWRTSTIGIIGLGNIGHQVATMASSLGIKVIYHNRTIVPNAPFEYVPLDELYKRADVVVPLTPLTEETVGLINTDSIAKMKDGVMIVNTSRGPVVKEDDLVQALESGKVSRAVLDVFENEPTIHPKLMTNPNVTLSPHMVFATQDIPGCVHLEVVENIIAFITTGKPNTPVNVPRLHKAGFHDM